MDRESISGADFPFVHPVTFIGHEIWGSVFHVDDGVPRDFRCFQTMLAHSLSSVAEDRTVLSVSHDEQSFLMMNTYTQIQ